MASINGNQGGGVIDLGTINSESQTKDSGLFQNTMPRTDSDGALLLDVFGCFRTIVLSGTLVGTETEQKTFITAIEAICNGKQEKADFVSSLTADTKKVFIQTFNWEVVEAVPSKITYTLTLLEGTDVRITE